MVAIHNDGIETYNISMITGSLNSPSDFNMHVQNFSNVVRIRTFVVCKVFDLDWANSHGMSKLVRKMFEYSLENVHFKRRAMGKL